MPEQDIPPPPAPTSPSTKRARLDPPSPAKKQSKWTPQEDALVVQLRGMGKKWNDISNALPGRSAISCRLHYQNYLERRPEWDEERKDLLANLYEKYDIDSSRAAPNDQLPGAVPSYNICTNVDD